MQLSHAFPQARKIMAFLSSGLLGASTFFAREHRSNECDAKGLPLTPNSVVMAGRFQRLKGISHKNLCAYLDLVKGSDGTNTPTTRGNRNDSVR